MRRSRAVVLAATTMMLLGAGVGIAPAAGGGFAPAPSRLDD